MKLFSLRKKRLFPALLLIGSFVLLFPSRGEAYAGPGAGFAVLSSFWTIFVAFLYSLYALLTWPIRQFFRSFRRRKAYGKAQVKRIVIVGFDGMDPELATRFMEEGKLPNLTKLRHSGTFRPLRTTFPAISPVAWSTFQTGVNPGKHNIYDFLGRDLANYLPFLSSAQIIEPKRRLCIGKYSLPLGKPEIKGMRRGTPFWHWLGKAGVFCAVLRVPVTFPPEKFQGVLLQVVKINDAQFALRLAEGRRKFAGQFQERRHSPPHPLPILCQRIAVSHGRAFGDQTSPAGRSGVSARKASSKAISNESAIRSPATVASRVKFT